jgi:tetratricopeptide (TPR) repeat protein
MPVSKKPRRKATGAKATAQPPPLPDRRAMEGYLVALGGPGRAEPAVAAAQEVMYDAWDAASRPTRVRLAHRALAISPLCADAYVLLAQETATTSSEARDLYAKGVEAGELALGPEAFTEDLGHFWGVLETRPYMRARHGLAETLWELGEREEAIAHYRDMLRLNPNDNQGIRYLLAACLVAKGDDAGLAELLDAYEDEGSTCWCYTRALLAFRTSGAGEPADALLAEAMTSYAYVPPYLVGEKKPPRQPPAFLTWGGEDEAAEYARDFGAGWRATPGALEWLAQARAAPPKPRRRGRPKTG